LQIKNSNQRHTISIQPNCSKNTFNINENYKKNYENKIARGRLLPMKKVLFMLINMNVGGTEKAFLNMLPELLKSKWNVTILMLERYGGVLNYIPAEVHVKYLYGYENMKEILNKPPKKVVSSALKKVRLIKAVILSTLYLVSAVKKDRTVLYKYLMKKCRADIGEYDVAVAFAGPMDFITYYVLNGVKAKRKVQWIHFDVTRIGFDKKFASKNYGKFDRIFTVSKEAGEKLADMFPELRGKIREFLNIVSSDLIREMAQRGGGFSDNFDGIRILTVGRLSKEKGQDITMPVLKKLRQKGYNVRWYCIGDGPDRKEYERLLKLYNIQDNYILLGTIPNPYPFMKQCSIYVQPSRHEGYCITLAEARCFNRPIVTTDFAGAREQIAHEKTGLIVNCEEGQIFSAVKRLLDDRKLYDQIKRNLEREKVDTRSEIEKFYEIF